MKLSHFRHQVIWILLASLWTAAAWAASPAQTYLDQLSHAVEQTRQQVPMMSASARKAADRVIKGGRILLAGQRLDFKDEAIGRAGGLMGLHFVDKKFTPKAGDVVLASSVAPWTPQEAGDMGQWIANGAQVVLFSSDIPADLKGKVDAIRPQSDPGVVADGKLCPADSVLNIVDLWVWVGEYVSACTEQGKMPVLYQSIGIPGGRERNAKYQGKMFQDDAHVAPIEGGVLGNKYLVAIGGYLKELKGESSKLTEASRWLSQAGKNKSGLVGIAHTFPALYRDPRATQLFSSYLQWTSVESGKESIPADCSLVFQLGYQYPPKLLLKQAKDGKYKLVYCSVQKGDVTGGNILYIDPHWPLADACVSLKGYDIPILPPSGVMQAAIYWSIAAGIK